MNFDPKKASAAQEKYCDEHEIPCFAPHDGICERCGRNIYLPTNGRDHLILGITPEEAGKMHITGCCHCGYSFCD